MERNCQLKWHGSILGLPCNTLLITHGSKFRYSIISVFLIMTMTWRPLRSENYSPVKALNLQFFQVVFYRIAFMGKIRGS